jgi:hypothetical protein
MLQKSPGTQIYELDFQWTNFFYEQNVESWGWNRKENEGRFKHLRRLMRCTYYQDSPDHAMRDLSFCGTMKLNDIYKVHPETYYFSITFGYRNNLSSKSRESLKLP